MVHVRACTHAHGRQWPPTRSPLSVAQLRRRFGGYGSDYDLTVYALEVYRDVHGTASPPPLDFIVPAEEVWPAHLHGRCLGRDVRKHGLVVDG